MKRVFYLIVLILLLACSENNLKEEFTLFEQSCFDLGTQWRDTVFPYDYDLKLSPPDLFDTKNIKEYFYKKDENDGTARIIKY